MAPIQHTDTFDASGSPAEVRDGQGKPEPPARLCDLTRDLTIAE